MSIVSDRPVRWASPTNAWALGCQLTALIIPILVVTEVYQPVALDELDQGLSQLWQWVLLVSTGCAIAATLTMRAATGNRDRMRAVIRLEAVATGIMAACLILLVASLVWKYGFLVNPLTQTIVGALGITALARVVQIMLELRKDRRAQAAGRVIHTEAIADPKET